MTTTGRAIGFWPCLALVIGSMVGSGIFLLPAALAPLGWNSVIGWGLTLAGSLCIATVFSVLARRMPADGGPYAYARAAFGPAPAFAVAWSYWISLWIGNAALAVAATSYLSVIAPAAFAVPGVAALVAIAIIWIIVAINLAGARAVGIVQLVTTALKLLPLIAVVAIAGMALAPGGDGTIRPPAEGEISIAGITAAATLTLWAFLGIEAATVPAGKIRDPARTIPRATLWGTLVAGLIYVFACSAVILMAPAGEVAASNAPFADFVARVWGPGAGLVVALLAAISCIGALNGWILMAGEMPYAMARAGAFPAWFGQANRSGAAGRAIIVSALLMTLVVAMNYSRSIAQVFTFLILLSTATSLFMYLFSALAALKLRAAGRLAPVAGLAAIYALWTIYGAGGEAVRWGAVLLVAGVPVYWLESVRRRRTLRRPAPPPDLP